MWRANVKPSHSNGMKPERKPLGRNPLSDASYRNPGMVLNDQGPGHHPHDAPCRDLGTVSSEQGLGRRILSGAPHRRLGVVQNEQHTYLGGCEGEGI